MADTKQDRAIVAANTVLTIASQLAALRATINQFVTQFTSEDFGAVWNNLQSAPRNADGSLGAADAAPTATHPIDTRVYPALNRANSANEIIQGEQMMTQLQNFFNGANVTTANYNAIIDVLSA